MGKIEGVIFDWAGTTVDFGCFAPVNVFVNIFKTEGIQVTIEEARQPMGLLKIDHIRAMLSMPRISQAWQDRFNRTFNEDDVMRLYERFEEELMLSLEEYADPIPDVIEAVKELRNRSIKIGSTTGYTQKMIDIVAKEAVTKGYAPDTIVTPDDVNNIGRPYPYMIFRNMERLQLSHVNQVVKVGDTIADINEAKASGVIAVGVLIGSSEMGLTHNEFSSLPPIEKEKLMHAVHQKFIDHGADYTIHTMADLVPLIQMIETDSPDAI